MTKILNIESATQVCSVCVSQNNEIIAYDTDLVGSYGICVDISRTFWLGDEDPRPDMVYAMQHAHEHIMTNMDMLKPGVHMRDLSINCHKLDDNFQKLKYGCMMHGVGLCDEWRHGSGAKLASGCVGRGRSGGRGRPCREPDPS